MKALIFEGPGKIALREIPIPKAGYGEVVIRVTLTTICGTDLHILRGEYPVQRGLIIGHEPVGRIHEIGPGVKGYAIGDRVLVGAVTPCNWWMALWKHDPWSAGRVSACAVCAK